MTNEITAAALETRDRMMATGMFMTIADINAGWCSEFAAEVLDRIGYPRATELNLDDIEIANLMALDPRTGFAHDYGGPFDREVLAKWPGTAPPDGLDWDDLDALSAHIGIGVGTHVLLTDGALFYDAEATEGVANLFELPFMQRLIEGWTAETRPALSA